MQLSDRVSDRGRSEGHEYGIQALEVEVEWGGSPVFGSGMQCGMSVMICRFVHVNPARISERRLKHARDNATEPISILTVCPLVHANTTSHTSVPSAKDFSVR